MQPVGYELNKKGAELAKQAAADVTKAEPHKPRFVTGAVGPTSRTLSVSPSVEDPSFRNMTWDELVESYEQEPSESSNHDEAVEYGAAVRSAILTECNHYEPWRYAAPSNCWGIGRSGPSALKMLHQCFHGPSGNCLRGRGIEQKNVHGLVLVGGST